jgi:hypothetical protein
MSLNTPPTDGGVDRVVVLEWIWVELQRLTMAAALATTALRDLSTVVVVIGQRADDRERG